MLRLKKFDAILILLVLTAALLLFLIFALRPQGNTAAVYVDGERLAELDLSKNSTYEMDGAEFSFVLGVEAGTVRMLEADCPDGTCKKTGAVGRSGGSIICLPNRVVVEVYGKRETDAVAE